MCYDGFRHLENYKMRTVAIVGKRNQAMASHRMRICVGYDEEGNPITTQIRGVSELELADKVVRAILHSERKEEFLRGMVLATEPEAPHFEPYAEEWYATYKAHRIKATTAYAYQLILRRLYEQWGDTPINQIGTKDIQEFLNERKHLAEKYLQEMLIVMKSIFESARRDGHIKENPATDKRIVIPSKKKAVRKALELDEMKDILLSLNKLDEMDKRYMMLLLFTGMRRGEVLGLKWEDVDLKKNVFHIERSITYPKGKNGYEIGKPKTESGLRDVPISQELLNCLQPIGAHGYIIGGDTPITLSVHRRMMERIRRTIDLHGASPHIFRHSYATLLNDAGASIKTIQSIIGHSDVQTTINRYVHSRDDKKQEAVRSVNEMLAPKQF